MKKIFFALTIVGVFGSIVMSQVVRSKWTPPAGARIGVTISSRLLLQLDGEPAQALYSRLNDSKVTYYGENRSTKEVLLDSRLDDENRFHIDTYQTCSVPTAGRMAWCELTEWTQDY